MTRYWVHSAPDDVEVGGGQRPCARGEHCKSATVWYDDDRSMHREPALGPRPFCEPDRALIIEALEWLPERYGELAQRLGEFGRGDGPKVSGGAPGSRPLIRQDFDDLMVKIVNTVLSWDERVRTIPTLKLSPRTGPARPEHRGSETAGLALTGMCTTLRIHIDALLALPPGAMRRYVTLREAAELAAEGDVVGLVRPDAGYAEVTRDRDGSDAGLELLKLDSRARRLLGWTPQHQDLPVPCWRCDHRMSVRRWDGGAGLEDRAECLQCGEKYEGERFTLLMAQVEQAARAKQTRAAS